MARHAITNFARRLMINARPSAARALVRTGPLSHTVLRGAPNDAQRHLDAVLAAAATALHGSQPSELNIPQILFHCMRANPHREHTINGSSGESFTNEQILRRAVRLSRALRSRFALVAGPAQTPVVLIAMRNHEHLVAFYYAALLAGHVPFLLDPLSTSYELRHFLPLTQPWLVACDDDRRSDALDAVRRAHAPAPARGHPGTGVLPLAQFAQFAAAHKNSIEDFVPSAAAADETAVILPTSGSTGLAKAALLTHRGLIAQMPSIWSHHTTFPRPTARAMFLSTAQWITHTILLTTCPVFGITALISPIKTPEHAVHMIDTYKPTWLLLVPGTADVVSREATSVQLSSLRTVLITGAPPAPGLLERLNAKLSSGARAVNSYGLTETHSFVCIPDLATPLYSLGRILNIFLYKLVSENGDEVMEPNKNGELYLKSENCIIKGYLRNEAAYRECAADGGWWRTGDVFFQDDEGCMHYVDRKKFWFKYLNYHISPEELEAVVGAVPGVQECAVAGTEAGAAAAVVLRKGCNPDDTRRRIHHAVDSELIEYKRLRGGVAFVEHLPRTRSGKLHRRECAALLQRLSADKHCL